MTELQLNQQRPLVLITGSSGLIGEKVFNALRDEFRIVGLDVQSPQPHVEIEWMHCDLTNAESVTSALGAVRAEYGEAIASVVHLAAYYDFSGEPSPLYQELTVEGTRRLLRALKAFDVEQFIFSSTLLAMQSADDDQPITALSRTEAEWAYPQSKLDAEQVIKEERGDIPAVVLRLAGVYDEECHSIPIAQQISRIYQKQWVSYFFPGDKSCGQAFIHLDDVAGCICRALKLRKELAPHRTFVIGEEDVMSYEELQEELGKLIHGEEWPAIRIPNAAAKAGAWVQEKLAFDEEDKPFIKPWMIDLADQNYPVNLTRARIHLSWEPRHTLRETLRPMIAQLERDPRRWFEMNGLPVPDSVEQYESAEETQ